MDRDTKEYIKDYLDDLLEIIDWFQTNYEDEELVEALNEPCLSIDPKTREDTDTYYDGVKKARDTVLNELIKGERQ